MRRTTSRYRCSRAPSGCFAGYVASLLTTLALGCGVVLNPQGEDPAINDSATDTGAIPALGGGGTTQVPVDSTPVAGPAPGTPPLPMPSENPEPAPTPPPNSGPTAGDAGLAGVAAATTTEPDAGAPLPVDSPLDAGAPGDAGASDDTDASDDSGAARTRSGR